MKGTIYLTVSALFYTIITTIIFFKKDKINKVENRIFKRLLIASILSMIMELSIVFTVNFDVIGTIIQKLFLNCLILWLAIFITYTFAITSFDSNITEEENIKKFKLLHYIHIFINCLICLMILLSPIKFNSIGDSKYTSGPAVDIVFITLGIYIFIMVILVLLHIKDIHKRGYIPIVALIILLIAVGIIQNIYPDMLLSNAVFGIIIYLMYHTIENPDLKMLRKMELARDQAEKANRAKSDFLSSMSHEIRTPLNAIIGLSEDIASYKEQVPQEVVEDTEDIQNASQTLLEIVGNILDINKIESAKMEIVDITYNYVEEITKMARVTSTRIGEKPIDFKMNFASDIPYELLGDKVHIKEIVNNLLTNAIKYTEKGSIILDTKCINQNDKCMLIITVQDTGRGIKAEYINKLFTKFERLDVEKNTTAEGTGLGLAITKSLVEMMGGRINVQSQYGQGSIFMVQIPQKISKMANPTLENKVTNIPQNEINIQNSEQYNLNNQESKLNNNKRILVVDDNKLNIKVARKHLESLGFIVDESLSGQGCIEKINNGERYDLILMDIMMPEMSGETTLIKLKEKADFNIPVIALTADAMAGAQEKYEKEGFVDYIAKPFTKEEIREKLEKVFSTNIIN